VRPQGGRGLHDECDMHGQLHHANAAADGTADAAAAHAAADGTANPAADSDADARAAVQLLFDDGRVHRGRQGHADTGGLQLDVQGHAQADAQAADPGAADARAASIRLRQDELHVRAQGGRGLHDQFELHGQMHHANAPAAVAAADAGAAAV